jgi:hypothetical protein
MPRARVSFALAAALAGLGLIASLAHAEPPVRPQVDTAALPALGNTWAEINPLRGNTDAIAIGRSAFNQACAACHGVDADGSRSPAPDLRRMGRGCRRVQEPELRQRCQSDADHFFVKSVRYGKQKFGVVHMPPWEGVLDPALVWSLRTFVENAPASPPPKVGPSLSPESASR